MLVLLNFLIYALCVREGIRVRCFFSPSNSCLSSVEVFDLRVPNRNLFSLMLTQSSNAASPPGAPLPMQFVVILISSEDKSSPSNLVLFSIVYHKVWGTRWRIWSRQSSTSRYVAGSFSRWYLRDFSLTNPSSRTTALGSTKPLTEMITMSISCG